MYVACLRLSERRLSWRPRRAETGAAQPRTGLVAQAFAVRATQRGGGREWPWNERKIVKRFIHATSCSGSAAASSFPRLFRLGVSLQTTAASLKPLRPPQMLQSLTHPNIVACVETFIHDGTASRPPYPIGTVAGRFANAAVVARLGELLRH